MAPQISEGGTGAPTEGIGGLSVPLGVHFAALREADLRFDQERDRRYTEVAREREKALKIKEEADEKALDLAREIQKYKDEKANELREQISSERGAYLGREEYVTAHKALEDKVEAMVRPLAQYVTAQQGRSQGISAVVAIMFTVATLVISLVVLIANNTI